MTYSRHTIYCSGYRRPLRNRDAPISSDPHNREGVYLRFPESSKHCMARGVTEKSLGKINSVFQLRD